MLSKCIFPFHCWKVSIIDNIKQLGDGDDRKVKISIFKNISAIRTWLPLDEGLVDNSKTQSDQYLTAKYR